MSGPSALVLLVLWVATTTAAGNSLPALNVIEDQTSVSGLSSGGFFAVQMHVAYSSIIVGAGIFAGGPYNCAQGNLGTALGSCMQGLPAPNIATLVQTTYTRAASGAVDLPGNLTDDHVYLFSGTDDTTVHPPVMHALQTYYTNFMPTSQIQFESTLKAAHTQPTINTTMNACTKSASPYVSYCDYDGAGIALQQILGTLEAPNRGALSGTVLAFDQSEFLPNPTSQSVAPTGYAYIPASCAAMQSCRVHVALHGCLQDAGEIGLDYVQGAGYNAWADTNQLVVLYPQTQASQTRPSNPNACWNWWGYNNDPDTYDTQQGSQMNMIRSMISQLAAGAVSIAAPSGLKVSSVSDSSVSLVWNSGVNITSYNVFRGGVKINSSPVTHISYEDTGLTSGSFYKYTITALMGSAMSPPSAPVVAHTQGTPPALTAPQGLAVMSTTNTSVTLEWNHVPGALTYQIYRDSQVAGNSIRSSFTDTTLAPSSSYTFQVAGVRQQQAGPESQGVVAMTKSSYVCQTFTSSNYAHVEAGRAYQKMGETYALGSNDDMGLYNVAITTTLAETSPDYYVIGNCA